VWLAVDRSIRVRKTAESWVEPRGWCDTNDLRRGREREGKGNGSLGSGGGGGLVSDGAAGDWHRDWWRGMPQRGAGVMIGTGGPFL